MIEHRLATMDDLDAIMEVVADAQHSLGSRGIDQWQNGYPNIPSLQGDIEKGVGHVLVMDGVVVSYAAIIINGEPSYEHLEGQWLSVQDYVVLHRLCVRVGYVRQGLALQMMDIAIAIAQSHGVKSFKIDTHTENTYMLSLLQKMGFVYCGIVYYDHGVRVAYEKLIS